MSRMMQEGLSGVCSVADISKKGTTRALGTALDEGQ
jgi:hypothetical protein